MRPSLTDDEVAAVADDIGVAPGSLAAALEASDRLTRATLRYLDDDLPRRQLDGAAKEVLLTGSMHD